jgi:hypothetical protein
MEAIASLNGSGVKPSASEQFLAEKVRELEEFLRPLSERRAQLESEIREIDREQRRVQAAIKALAPLEPEPESRKPRTVGRRDWSRTSKPSEENLRLIAEAIRKADRPLGVGEIHAALGGACTKETISRGAAWLRDTEQIRVAGRHHNGKSHGLLYAVMP